MKVTWFAAAFAVAVNAAAAPGPEITPAPLAMRQEEPLIDPMSDLGDPATYVLTDLGPDNPVISVNGDTYHYIQNHANYLTVETVTTTIDNVPTETVSTVIVAVKTATVATTEQAVGDITLTFSQEVGDALAGTAKEAIAACGLVPAKRRMAKRLDSMQCIVDAAVKASGESGPLEAAGTAEFWQSIAVTAAADAPEYLNAALAVAASQAAKNKLLIALAAIVAGTKIAGSIAALNLPASGVGGKAKADDPKACDPNRKVDENSYVCDDEKCKGVNEICTVGEDEGCPCAINVDAHAEEFDQAFSDEQQKIIGEAIDAPEKEPPRPECDVGKSSSIPWNVFDPTIYTQFCDTLSAGDKSKELAQIVGSDGNVIPPKVKRDRLAGRTPPPNPGAYAGYSIELHWTGGDGSCSSECSTSFKTIAQSPCGHTAGQQNIMSSEASLDTGCGIYSYKISPPPGEEPEPEPVEITVGPIQCIPNPGNIKCWHDVHERFVESTASALPNQFGNDREMRSDSPNRTQVLRDGGQSGKGVTYMMNVGWIPGCTIAESQNIDNPIPGNTVVSAPHLAKAPYKGCTGNDGLGGWQDVGCLRYGFYPNNAGVFDSPPHPEKFFDKMSYCG